MNVIWSNKVSDAFIKKVVRICNQLGINPNFVMACIAFETGETFSASIRNRLSGATGLIQFMPQTAAALGTSTEELAAMTPVKQLDFVYKYFLPWKGKLRTLEDVYMAILWPRAVGRPSNYVLFNRNGNFPKAYIQNAGLDINKDGKITKAEAAMKVTDKFKRGLNQIRNLKLVLIKDLEKTPIRKAEFIPKRRKE